MPPRHCITVSLRHHITAPLCHHITAPSRHHITTLVSHLPCPLPPNQSVSHLPCPLPQNHPQRPPVETRRDPRRPVETTHGDPQRPPVETRGDHLQRPMETTCGDPQRPPMETHGDHPRRPTETRGDPQRRLKFDWSIFPTTFNDIIGTDFDWLISPLQPIRSFGLNNLINIKSWFFFPTTSLKSLRGAKIDELADSNEPAINVVFIYCKLCSTVEFSSSISRTTKLINTRQRARVNVNPLEMSPNLK